MKTVKKLVLSSLLASLVCVATMIIKIPSPLKGYINIGDGAVLLSAFLMPTGYGALAAGVGSALADLFSGYAVYAPATFVIKALMALCFKVIITLLAKNSFKSLYCIIAGIVAELVMIGGYLLFEGILYGFAEAVVNIPANSVQAVAGVLVGTALIKLFDKLKLDI